MLNWHRQARLFSSLGTTLESGLPPDRALELAASTAGGVVGTRARQAAMRVTSGTPLGQALEDAGEDPLACAVLRAGDKAGRTPVLCKQLGETYTLRAKLRDEVASRLAYPVLLIHIALILLPLPWVVGENGISAWFMLLGPAVVWGLVGAGVITTWWSGKAGLLGRLALRWPFAALCRPALAADSTAVLGAALSAGMLVPDALELAARACANRQLAQQFDAAAAGVRQHRIPDLTSALATCGFAGDILELVRTGEHSGKLEQGLGHARVVASERFAWRLNWTARLTTGTIYGIAMVIAAAAVFTMYGHQIGQLQEIQKDLE